MYGITDLNHFVICTVQIHFQYMRDNMSNNPADNMYCMVSFADKDGKSHGNHPQILEIQGVVWFATEELAREYYMMLKPN